MENEFAQLLRAHRTLRRRSQESLALAAGLSPRHLSCLETGKARPSRLMVLRLGKALDLNLRERNALLNGAGFVEAYSSTPLDSEAMAPVNRAIDRLLHQHEPFAALLLDRCWNVIRVNEGARRLFDRFSNESAIAAPIMENVVRVILHPEGIRPYIVNWDEVAALTIERVERAYRAHPADRERRALHDEILGYPDVDRIAASTPSNGAPVATLHLRRDGDELRLMALLTSIGTPHDVTAAELTVESLFPVDEVTTAWFGVRD